MSRHRPAAYTDFEESDSEYDTYGDNEKRRMRGRRETHHVWDAYRITVVALLTLFYVTFVVVVICAAVATHEASQSAQRYTPYLDQAFSSLEEVQRAVDQYTGILAGDAVVLREDDVLWRIGRSLLAAESGASQKRGETQANVRAVLYKYTLGFMKRIFVLVNDGVSIMESGAPSVNRAVALFDRVTRVANETLSGASQEVPRLSNMLHRVMDTLEENHGISLTIPLMSDTHDNNKRAGGL